MFPDWNRASITKYKPATLESTGRRVDGCRRPTRPTSLRASSRYTYRCGQGERKDETDSLGNRGGTLPHPGKRRGERATDADHSKQHRGRRRKETQVGRDRLLSGHAGG